MITWCLHILFVCRDIAQITNKSIIVVAILKQAYRKITPQTGHSVASEEMMIDNTYASI